jgi:O-antigen/teichoic acid export membrane protein
VFAVVEAVAGAVVAVLLARSGFGLWALLSVDAVRCVLALPTFYAWRPVWKPRLLWSSGRVRYFVRFGSRNVVGTLLDTALQRLDKLWLGLALDRFELGLYSRADRFARIPGNLVGGPVVSVSGGAFAALGNDRERLSQAVFQVAAVAVRGSFLLAGTLTLIAPEFVALVLGERWLPIVPSMRILVAAFPLALTNRTLAQLFLARGRPATLVRVRGVQVAALTVGLAVLAPGLGREGAAFSVAAASLGGLVLSLRAAREHVELSSRKLFLAPILALAVSISGTTLGTLLLAPETMGATAAALKAAAAIGLYGLVLWGLERRELARAFASVLRESSQ